MPSTIASLVQNFTRDLTAAIEAATSERIRATLTGFLGVPLKRGPGRPPKNGAVVAPRLVTRKDTLRKQRQGRYLGLLRSLTGSARSQVQNTAREKGVLAALSLGAKLKR